MWMALASKDTRTDRERYLEDELDSLREQQEREYQRREDERKRREHERHEEYEYEMRQAYDWPDALNKQAILCRRECDLGDEVDGYFSHTAEACEKARELWREIEASKRAEIESLEKQIAVIRDSIRLEVADRLEAASQRNEFAQVASQVRDDQLVGFLDW